MTFDTVVTKSKGHVMGGFMSQRGQITQETVFPPHIASLNYHNEGKKAGSGFWNPE